LVTAARNFCAFAFENDPARRQRLRRGLDLRRAEREAMVRLRAGDRRRAFDRVEPAHRLLGAAPLGVRARTAALGEVARIPDR
jgi:hypothetical protein